jgi:hypothetical protein
MNMKKILFATMLLSVGFLSCKDDDDDTCALNNSSLVGTYQLTGVSYKADATTPAIDIFSTYDACEKDDLVVFNANGSVTYTDAGIACSPSTNDTGTWSLSGSTLTVDGEAASVASFTCTGMTVTIAGTTAGELTTLTFVRR